MSETSILEVRNVTRTFPGVMALDNVSIDFRAGEIHAIIGENGAGKSTMMNVLAGEISPDSGTILVDGREMPITSPRVSQKLGIKVVFQELSLCQNLSVGENVLLGAFAAQPAISYLNRTRSGRMAADMLARLGMYDVQTDTPLAGLTVAKQQLVEIARAISQEVRILILDEPNSALSPRETGRLFDVVRNLKSQGVTIIYVSHHLEEVLVLADRISVMRDGRMITTLENGPGVSLERLVAHMIGRSINASGQYALRSDANAHKGNIAMEVRELSVPSHIRKISFQLWQGEILGVAGLPDSGKDVLADAIFGLLVRSGEIEIGGIRLAPHRPSHAIAAGMSFVPADRRGAGVLLSMNVAENVISSALERFTRAGFLRLGLIRGTAQQYVDKLDARIASLGQKIATLSGGNQQKIILARGLVTGPRVLMLHEPTRGIDVGAKVEIYDILKSLAADGMAILMISSELPEIILHSSRVMVMADKIIMGQLRGSKITEEAIMSLATRSDRERAA
ncbi:MAG: sugar ABC transporter ATP-binding protein [Alphaproteobacteria bacterium]|nr:sugar ABC transporter ATP-binding protein [Alphaproteobacteria bacterium]